MSFQFDVIFMQFQYLHNHCLCKCHLEHLFILLPFFRNYSYLKKKNLLKIRFWYILVKQHASKEVLSYFICKEKCGTVLKC